ncbi:sugar phosphate isomerase/epimerase family protein [Bauldia litoralis]|uniref:sugar phosphate isomerase/epimerase family protein n=1 Tax=Bauldia litoralis TaxID=665467 RepID=UPI003267F5FE
MLLGFNMLLWASQLTDEHFPLLEKLKAAGYDGAELPIFGGTPEEYAHVGRELKNLGLRATAVCVIPDKEHDCTSSDAKVRAAGLAHLKWAIDCLEAAGGELLCGPFYQPLAVFSGDPPTPEELAGIVEVHKEAARYAARAGIKMAIEPLNRFECYALNTAADAAEIVKRVDEPNYGYLYDTFHANIEEKDPVGVIAPTLAQINHVHTSENDRGTPGKGHVPWPETFKALKDGGYDGWYVIEAFGRALPGIAEATRVWRDFFPHTDEVYQFGHDFLREQWKKA